MSWMSWEERSVSLRVIPCLLGGSLLAALSSSAGAAGHAVTATPLAPPAASVAAPVKLAAAEAETLRAAILKDRKETLDWLKTSPTSYLATIQRRDFEDKKVMTVGSATDDDVRIDDPSIPAHLLRVTVLGDSFHVESLSGGMGFKVKDAETSEATLAPSAIGLGRFTLRLSHQRFPAIIVFDPKSPR